MKRIVVKVGSAVLTQDGEIALERMKALVDFLAELKKTMKLFLYLLEQFQLDTLR